MEPPIQYCTTSDGVSIAYAALGDGPAIVFAPSIWGDLHLYASGSSGHQKTDALIERGWQVILYDGRGGGYSQRSATDFSVEARLRDLDAVIGAPQVNRLVLCGRVASGLTAIAYAVQHPERISHLALINAYARGADFTEAIPAVRAATAMMRAVAAEQWEFYTLNLANAITGFSDSERARRQAAIYRAAMSPQAYLASWEASEGIDVTSLLASISTPTLVVHDKSDTFGDFSALARELASRIAGARLISTEDPTAAIDQFLREGETHAPAKAPVELPAAVHTILFTDIEASTALTERLGDAKAREVLREHERVVREALATHGGSEVKTMGDGFMASFGSATKAVECAVAIQKAFEATNQQTDKPANQVAPLRVRIGLNAGEPVAEEGPDGRSDLFGSAVNMAARIAGQARGGEILVSDVVRQLVAGKGFVFDDRGEQALKGFEEPVRVYEVRWGEDG